jgi:hypothetical protein
MIEPASEASDPVEVAVEQPIAICDGDVRAALRAALVANSFLMDEVERLTRATCSASHAGGLRLLDEPARDWSAGAKSRREARMKKPDATPRGPNENRRHSAVRC